MLISITHGSAVLFSAVTLNVCLPSDFTDLNPARVSCTPIGSQAVGAVDEGLGDALGVPLGGSEGEPDDEGTVADGAGVVAAGVAVVGWFFGVNAQISSPMTTTAISATRPRRIQYTDGGCGPLPVSTSLMSQG
ncbi:hypothetical protein GCM10009529_27880 [Micropruina glycogenica]